MGTTLNQCISAGNNNVPICLFRYVTCTAPLEGHTTRSRVSAHLSAFLSTVLLLHFPARTFFSFPTSVFYAPFIHFSPALIFSSSPHTFPVLSSAALVHRLPFSSWSLPFLPMDYYSFLFSSSLPNYFSCL